MSDDRKPVAARVAGQHAAALAQLPFADRSDFDDARRGLVAGLDPGAIESPDGAVVWDLDSYGFLDAAPPVELFGLMDNPDPSFAIVTP